MDPQWAAESNLTRVLALTGTIHVLALLSIGLRIYARTTLLRSPGRDDAVIVLASILTLGGWICFILQGQHGLGRHSKVVSKQDLIIFEKISFLQAIISAIGALGLLKISIALSLLRLSKSRWYSYSLWVLIGFVSFYSIGAWLTFFFRCRPMAAFWNPALGGSCYSMQLFKSFAMANTAYLYQLSGAYKCPNAYEHIGILSLGYLAVGMGITKTVYQLSLVTNQDRTFESSVQFWGFMQLNVGIIAATIPTLRPLLAQGGLTRSYKRYNHHGSHDRQANATIGSGIKTPRSRGVFSTSMYRDTDGEYEMTKDDHTASNRGGITHIYSVRDDRSGSEDDMLRRSVRGSTGIKCTTEIVIGDVTKDHDSEGMLTRLSS